MTEEQRKGAKKITAHSSCDHPATKAARAKCRRSKGKITVQQSAGAAVEMKPAVKRAENCTKCGEEFTTTEVKALDVDPVCGNCATPEVLDAVADVDRLTRENWREFKNHRVTVFIYNRMPVKNAVIQGWGAKYFDYLVQGASKSTRIAADEVERVLLLNG
ncbi:hypothetical protein MRI28_19510 [Nocardiopsis dassonvillei]|uniref:hypothetical protein n=1 Tax=Nocardiopsis dassonvillei TaxID=2014 RepID=UPI00200C49A1|nr:hypothetical protein [Nocardiopsis dassonvillei]MCK9871796.1 hypothetical protein [Nocardiopsis dassonvillei]